MKKLLLWRSLLAGAGICRPPPNATLNTFQPGGAHVGRSETRRLLRAELHAMLTNRLACRLSGLREAGNLGCKRESTRSIRAGCCSLPNCSASGRLPTCICCWEPEPATSGPTRMERVKLAPMAPMSPNASPMARKPGPKQTYLPGQPPLAGGYRHQRLQIEQSSDGPMARHPVRAAVSFPLTLPIQS